MKRAIFYLFVVVLVIASSVLITAAWWTGDYFSKNVVEVDAVSILTPFGDEITQVSYECCYGFIVTIDDIVSDQSIDLMFYPGISQLYREYMIFSSGPLTVGNYFPIGICIEIDEECESVSTTDGTITIVGTSQQ